MPIYFGDDPVEDARLAQADYYADLLRRDNRLLFRPVIHLTGSLEDTRREEGSPRSSVAYAFGSVEAFADFVFEQRLRKLSQWVTFTVWAIVASALLITMMTMAASSGSFGSGLALLWEIPLAFLIFGAGAALVGVVAMLIVWWPFAAATGFVLEKMKKNPEMARAWYLVSR